MTETLHIEISGHGDSQWRVVERSHLTIENIHRVSFDAVELTKLIAEINHCILNAGSDDTAQRAHLRRLGARVAELILPVTLRDKVANAVAGVEFFLDDAAIHLPIELLPHQNGILAECVPVSRRWVSERPPGACAGTVRGSRKQALIVADPAGDLPGAAEEGAFVFRKLRSGTAGYQCRYLGRAVTKAELSQELPDTDLLHLAGHYVSSGLSGNGSGLRVADGLWYPHNSFHAPEIVFANCCRAGTTDDMGDDISLIGCFLQRGSRHVVAPFLPVPDGTATLFAREFYLAWEQGIGVARAVHAAREKLGLIGWSYRHFGPIAEADTPTTATTPPSLGDKKRNIPILVAIAVLVLMGILIWLAAANRKTPEIAETESVPKPIADKIDQAFQEKQETRPRARVAREIVGEF